MKILIAILVILLIAASLFADYKWRQWIAARKRDRQ
jgi:general stress protein CsbA